MWKIVALSVGATLFVLGSLVMVAGWRAWERYGPMIRFFSSVPGGSQPVDFRSEMVRVPSQGPASENPGGPLVSGSSGMEGPADSVGQALPPADAGSREPLFKGGGTLKEAPDPMRLADSFARYRNHPLVQAFLEDFNRDPQLKRIWERSLKSQNPFELMQQLNASPRFQRLMEKYMRSPQFMALLQEFSASAGFRGMDVGGPAWGYPRGLPAGVVDPSAMKGRSKTTDGGAAGAPTGTASP